VKLTIFICFVLLVLGGMLKVQYAQEQIDAMIQSQGAEMRWYKNKAAAAGLVCSCDGSWSNFTGLQSGRMFIAGQEVSKEEWREFMVSRGRVRTTGNCSPAITGSGNTVTLSSDCK